MKLFSALYARTTRWSRHRHAPWYLGGMSSAESSFFPIPPDAMLAPMSLANPSKAWRFALIAMRASVASGLSMALLAFILASLIGRGTRFFLVAGLMAWGGARMEGALHRTIDRLRWAIVALVVIGAIIYHWSGMS